MAWVQSSSTSSGLAGSLVLLELPLRVLGSECCSRVEVSGLQEGRAQVVAWEIEDNSAANSEVCG